MLILFVTLNFIDYHSSKQAFQKTSWELLDPDQTQFTDDIAKIYSINVTNTKLGGASQCVACPRGSKGILDFLAFINHKPLVFPGRGQP